MYEFIIINGIGDAASVAGVLIALVGFFYTIRGVIRSKKASEQAEEAVRNVREDVLKANTVEGFTSILVEMDELKRLQRSQSWDFLPDLYTKIRKSLISIKTFSPNMSDKQKTTIQSMITHFGSIENRIEKTLSSEEGGPDPARLNAIISKQIDNLQEIVTEIKHEIGR